MEIELILLFLTYLLHDIDCSKLIDYKKRLITFKMKCSNSVDEGIFQVMRQTIHQTNNVKVVICENCVISSIVHIEINPEILVLDFEHIVMFAIILLFWDCGQFLDLGDSGKTEETFKVQINDPKVPSCHHKEDSSIDFEAEDNFLQIDPDGGDLLEDLLITCVWDDDIQSFVKYSNSISENINGTLDDEIVRLFWRS